MLGKAVISRESEIKIEMRKASFGGDRSEAGRYAANIRWQENVKNDDKKYPKELTEKEMIKIIYKATSVEDALGLIAKALGKDAKPQIRVLDDSEVTHFRGASDTKTDIGFVLDWNLNDILFATWGQGLYISPLREEAALYGNTYRLNLDESAKLITGEIPWSEGDKWLKVNEGGLYGSSKVIDFSKLKFNPAGTDLINFYWASKGYDGAFIQGDEVVLFNGSKLTVDKRDLRVKKSNDLVEFIKASFGGDRSEAGRYAANIRWQRQRGETKSETKGSLPLIFQPTWDETEAQKTGRPWAPLLEENYPPELQKAIRENISAWTKYYEAEINGAEKFKLADLNLKISKLEPIDPLLYQYLENLKLSGDVLTATMFALSSRIWSEIQTNKTLITRQYEGERKIGSPFKPIEEYVNGKDMRVVVNVPPNVLSQIIGDGRIKSQFETKTSKGLLDTYARQTAETRMFGTHPEVSAKNRTIYGHVMNEGVDDSIQQVAIHYGRTAIVMKKDVAERTTFTVGDSLMNGSKPSRISDPKDSSYSFWDAIYTEAQIHGQVKVSDIAYIVTAPDSISSGLQTKLEKLGIPVVFQDLTGGGVPRQKFKIEETGDMTKTVGHLIAVRGDGHKLFHTHTETEPLSNMVMRLGFLEDENGERLDVNVDSALRYGYWEEPNSLVELIKASFGGDRSEAGRYAANIRWQNNAKDKGTGFVSPTKMKETLLMDGLGRNMLLSDVEILGKSKMKDFVAQLIGQTPDVVDKLPEDVLRSPDLQAKLAKREVVNGIVAGMQDITVEEIRLACDELGIIPNTKNTDVAKQDMLTKFAQHFVDQWAHTSNDHETDSLMVQEVVKRVFNLQDATPVDSLENYSDIKNYQEEAESKLKNSPSLEKALTALVKAQYANTQAYLASKGITEVVIYRGMNHPALAEDLKDYRLSHFYKMEERGEIVLEERDGLSADERNSDITGNISDEEFDQMVPEGVVKVSMKMRPLSSFSLERGIANGFRTNDGSQGSKDEGVFLATRVPVARIFATPLTGVGCLEESEFVILGGELDAKASRSSAGDEDFDYDNMFPSRKEEIKSYG